MRCCRKQRRFKGNYKARIPPVVDTDRTNVERAIRHAIKLAWERGDRDVFADFFQVQQ